MKKIVVMTAIVLCTVATAQEGGGKALLKDFFQSLAEYSKPVKGRVYYMEMEVAVRYKPSRGLTDTDTKIKNIVWDDNSYMNSDQMAYYTDKEECFTIIYPEKTIVRADYLRSNGAGKYKIVSALQDTLLMHSTVVSNKPVREEGRSCKEITLKTDAWFSQRSGIKQFVFYYDQETKRVYKTISHFTDRVAKDKEVVTYKKIDLNYNKKPFKGARDLVFDAQGALLANYKTYELIDNRKLLKK